MPLRENLSISFRMRVVMLDPSNFSPPYNDQLCAALAADGAEVTLYVRPLRLYEHYSCDGYVVREHFYRVSELFIRIAWLRPLGRYLKAMEHVVGMMGLVRQLRRSRPDIIHFQWCPLPMVDRMFLAVLRRISPLVLTVHNTRPFHGNPSSRLQGIGWLKILSEFDQLIVHTSQSHDQLLAIGCSGEKISVIAHGPLYARAGEIDSAAMTEQPHPDNELKTILFFGNVKPYKGVDVLLQAFARIPESIRKNARVMIAGRSSVPPSDIEAMVAHLGLVKQVELDLRFLPDQELSALLRSAYMVVFPYRDIDASGALMLALPYGKPIVASQIGVFSEILTDGETALLTSVNDVDGLAVAIGHLLTDSALAERLGRASSRLVGDFHSWSDIARLTMTTYDELRR